MMVRVVVPSSAAFIFKARSIEAGHVPDRLVEGLWDLIQGTDITAYNLYRRAVHNRPMVPKPDGVHQVYFLCQAEQAPNPDSRVMLTGKTDALGMPRVALDWRLSAIDKHSVGILVETLGAELRRLGLGDVRAADWLADESQPWRTDPPSVQPSPASSRARTSANQLVACRPPSDGSNRAPSRVLRSERRLALAASETGPTRRSRPIVMRP